LFSCARRFNRSVEREQVGLIRDVINYADNRADLL